MVKIHEHIIEVTNPHDDLADVLNVSMLWRQLEHFARHPSDYVEAMKKSVVHEHFDGDQLVLERELHFGGVTVMETVRFDNGQSVISDVQKSENYPASRFTISLEAPAQEGYYFLRFIYEEDTDKAPEENIYLQLRKQAYEQKDRDLVDMIRQNARSLKPVH